MGIRAGNRFPQKGFTLLEMLVVVILTGMVSALLFQGLQQVFRLDTHMGRELFNTQERAMYTQWFRQSVNGMIPDSEGGKNRFRGSEREFAGLTIAPVNAATEALLAFSWRLRFDPGTGRTQLAYGPAEGALVVMDWQGNSGRFVYVDRNDKHHAAWPPSPGKWPQLPRAIYLETLDPLEKRLVVAAPLGPDDFVPRPKDALD